MVLTEAQDNLRKKGYPESDIDIWTAGYEFAAANPDPLREAAKALVEEFDSLNTRSMEAYGLPLLSGGRFDDAVKSLKAALEETK